MQLLIGPWALGGFSPSFISPRAEATPKLEVTVGAATGTEGPVINPRLGLPLSLFKNLAKGTAPKRVQDNSRQLKTPHKINPKINSRPQVNLLALGIPDITDSMYLRTHGSNPRTHTRTHTPCTLQPAVIMK